MLLENLHSFSKTNRIAVQFKDESLSYSELWSLSESIAWYLKENYPSDLPVAIYGDKECNMVACMIGALKAGKTYVILPSTYPDSRLFEILDDCNAEVLLKPSIQSFKCNIKTIGPLDFQCLKDRYRLYPTINFTYDLNDTAFIQYTSGSTGNPKGVMISFGNIEAKVKDKITGKESLDIDCPADDIKRVISLSSYGFIASIIMYYHIGYAGDTWFTIPAETVKTTSLLFDFFKNTKLNSILLTPSSAKQLLTIADFNASILTEIHTITLAGEPLLSSIAKSLYEKFPGVDIYNYYASTETTGLGSTCKLDLNVLNCNSLYMPVSKYPNARMCLLDSNDYEMSSPNSIGEIIILGESVSLGYYDNEGLTTTHFFILPNGKRAFKTGDLGMILNGYIYILGRKDNQIKIGGNRIEIEDIEAHIMNCSIVDDCAVSVQTESNQSSSLVCFVVKKDAYKDLADLPAFLSIKKELKSRIEPYKIPQKIVFLESLPRNKHNKIDRIKLKNYTTEKRSSTYE